MRLRTWACATAALVCACASCKPISPPIVPDAQVDGGCATLDQITASRLIRNPDGTPLVIHCDAGSP